MDDGGDGGKIGVNKVLDGFMLLPTWVVNGVSWGDC